MPTPQPSTPPPRFVEAYADLVHQVPQFAWEWTSATPGFLGWVTPTSTLDPRSWFRITRETVRTWVAYYHVDLHRFPGVGDTPLEAARAALALHAEYQAIEPDAPRAA